MVRTGQCVRDGGARRSGLGDPFVEFSELALSEFQPGVQAIGTRGDERLQLAQREAGVSQGQDQPDQSHVSAGDAARPWSR